MPHNRLYCIVMEDVRDKGKKETRLYKCRCVLNHVLMMDNEKPLHTMNMPLCATLYTPLCGPVG